MNLKEHVSESTLELVLRNELSEGESNSIKLHLSYCPICREQKDELALKLAAQRMWVAFKSRGSAGEVHIENKNLRDFCRGQLRDHELIKQISRHCIACLDCRRRRELVRVEIAKQRAGEPTLLVLALAVARWVSARRYHLAAMIALVALALVTIKLLSNAESNNRPPSYAANLNSLVPAPSENAESHNPPQLSASGQPPPNKLAGSKTSSRGPTELRQEVSRDLLAQVQTIDLRHAAEGTDSRSPGEAAKTSFKIVARRSSPIKLRVDLPPHSKRGVYLVSIRDVAFLDEIAPAESKSKDGKSLLFSISLPHLDKDEFVLRIERRNPTDGNREYVGDYPVIITRPLSESDRQIQDTHK